jgi:hypothetical protein
MTEESKIVMLTDILEQKLRKERELDFYQKELEKLQEKMYWLKREIDLNNTIIDIIKNETMIDLAASAEEKLLIRLKDDIDADDV